MTGRTVISSELDPPRLLASTRQTTGRLSKMVQETSPAAAVESWVPFRRTLTDTAPVTCQEAVVLLPKLPASPAETSSRIAGGATSGPWARTGPASPGQARARRTAVVAMVAIRRLLTPQFASGAGRGCQSCVAGATGRGAGRMLPPFFPCFLPSFRPSEYVWIRG